MNYTHTSNKGTFSVFRKQVINFGYFEMLAHLQFPNRLIGVKAVGRLQSVGVCARNFTPTVGLITPTNVDSNVDSAVGINPQSELDKEVSDDNLAPQSHIRRRVG